MRARTVALGMALPAAAAYLALAPPAADLAAATYRSDLFARVGFATWDTGWYAAHGHHLPAYSLLAPALGALLGVRLLLALSTVAASLLFASIAQSSFGDLAARASAAVFALGACVAMLSGRVPFQLGLAIGLGSLLACMRRHVALALALGVLASLASPVAGVFLALAAVAYAAGHWGEQAPLGHGSQAPLGHGSQAPEGHGSQAPEGHGSQAPEGHGSRAPEGLALRGNGPWVGLALAAAALLPVVVLTLAYPEGGYEPFAPSAFWPPLAGVLAIAALLPRGPLSLRAHRALRIGAALYALALLAAFAVHTPMGGNAARLGPLLAAPLLAGLMWERRRAALFALAPALLYWQLVTPIRDLVQVANDPSVHSSYYAPLLSELRHLDQPDSAAGGATGAAGGANGASGAAGGAMRERARPPLPTIVEVPLTKAHWEAAYLAGHGRIALARGWERQLDTRYARLFYRRGLTADAYRRWLVENRVAYVALPDAPLDRAGRAEGALVARGVPYLRQIWHSRHWRLFAVMGYASS